MGTYPGMLCGALINVAYIESWIGHCPLSQWFPVATCGTVAKKNHFHTHSNKRDFCESVDRTQTANQVKYHSLYYEFSIHWDFVFEKPSQTLEILNCEIFFPFFIEPLTYNVGENLQIYCIGYMYYNEEKQMNYIYILYIVRGWQRHNRNVKLKS